LDLISLARTRIIFMKLKPLYWLTSVALMVGFVGISTRREALAKAHEHTARISQKEKLAQAQSASNGQACAQLAPGSIVEDPPEVDISKATDLIVNADPNNPGQNCFLYEDKKLGLQEAPTLRVKPGKSITLNLKNALPGDAQLINKPSNNPCPWDGGMPPLNATSLHYHGLNVSPQCGQDNSVQTVVAPGKTFSYNIPVPKDDPPGLYWYHPHVHMQAESQVLSGLTGNIVVEGIGKFNKQADKLPERVFVLRDLVPVNDFSSEPAPFEPPAKDVSINGVPIRYLGQGKYDPPAVIEMRPNEEQFWRIANTSADNILDLQVTYDGAVQQLRLVGMDGVPVNADVDKPEGQTLPVNHVLLAPGGRAEFIIKGPGEAVKDAQFLTLKYDTKADIDPQRTIARIEAVGKPAKEAKNKAKQEVDLSQITGDRFYGLNQVSSNKARTLFFSQKDVPDPNDPNATKTEFYMTEEGKEPQVYMMGKPPAITLKEGTTEDWTVENRAEEAHVFHIHQIHFLVLDSSQQAADIGMVRDTITVPAWEGKLGPDGKPTIPYPKVKLRMDFRGEGTGKKTTSIAGLFFYHCHILEHEDGGMMQEIQITP
jgi:FtsP/CotA-like multicopper oxidase with cupredoxin domain